MRPLVNIRWKRTQRDFSGNLLKAASILAPAPRQKKPQISPIFKADTVRLQVSREKDRKLLIVTGDPPWHTKSQASSPGLASGAFSLLLLD
jgi:hypothetical protein